MILRKQLLRKLSLLFHESQVSGARPLLHHHIRGKASISTTVLLPLLKVWLKNRAPGISTSEPETSYAIEGTPANHSLLAESGSPDDERNAVNQSETIEPRATEAEHMFSPVDVADDRTSDSAPILAVAEQLPEVVSQEIIQPESAEVLVTEDVQDNRENQVENITTKLEEHDTAEDTEAKENFVVKEVDLIYFCYHPGPSGTDRWFS
jgi:hypothetical protein